MNNEFENRLRQGLAEQSDAIEIEGAGPSAVVSRAAERQRQIGIGRAMAGLVVVACLGALAFTQFSNNGSDDFIAAEELEDDSATPSTVAGNIGNSGIAAADFGSQIVDGGDGYGAFLTDAGQLIQITTQPGISWEDYPEEGPPMVVMVSDANGVIETNEIEISAYGPVSSTYFDGVLYTVTTSPESVNDGNDVVINTSTDYGKNWSTQTIAMPPVPNPEITEVWRDSRVSVNNAGVLLTIQSGYWANFAKILPQYSYENGNFEISQTETGVEVRDWTEYAELSEERAMICERLLDGIEQPTDEDFEKMEECWSEMEELPRPDVIASFTWAELGIEPFSQEGESDAFFAPDGKNFEKVTVSEGNFSNWVVSTRNGFMTQVYPDYPEGDYGFEAEPDHDGSEDFYMPTWLASSDGRNWKEVSLPGGVCNVSGSQGEVFVGQVCDNSGKTFVSTDVGNTWSAIADVPTDAAEGYISYSTVFGGEMGFIAFRNTEPDYSHFEDEFYADDPEAEEAMGDEPAFYDEGNRTLEVLFSSDGQTWSLVELPAEVQGDAIWGNGALIGANNIVLTVGSATEDNYKVRHVFLTPS